MYRVLVELVHVPCLPFLRIARHLGRIHTVVSYLSALSWFNGLFCIVLGIYLIIRVIFIPWAGP